MTLRDNQVYSSQFYLRSPFKVLYSDQYTPCSVRERIPIIKRSPVKKHLAMVGKKNCQQNTASCNKHYNPGNIPVRTHSRMWTMPGSCEHLISGTRRCLKVNSTIFNSNPHNDGQVRVTEIWLRILWHSAHLPQRLQFLQLFVVVVRILSIVLQDELEKKKQKQEVGECAAETQVKTKLNEGLNPNKEIKISSLILRVKFFRKKIQMSLNWGS